MIFVLGILLFLYPTISDWWNSFHQSVVISQYSDQIERLNEKQKEELLEEALEYNKNLGEQGISWNLSEDEKKRYTSVLSMHDDGMMGYVEIPSIDCRLPLYHGTEESVLQIGAGHLEGSSLPVGGPASHCIISGHRGLPSARLFTGLDQLEKGDLFLLHVLDETIYYEVERIETVLPEDTQILKIEKGKDLCTLVTCTPYGINTHRLLVTGNRIEKETAQTNGKVMNGGIEMRLMKYIKWIVLCLLVVLFWVGSHSKASAASKEAESDNEKSSEITNYEIEVQYPFEGIEFRIYDAGTIDENVDSEWIKKSKPFMTQATGVDGKASFAGLKPGFYVIAGEIHEENNFIFTPVLSKVQILEKEEMKSKRLIISPKYEKEAVEKTPAESSEEASEGTLPQTEKNWSAVIFLLLLGLLVLAAGWLKSRK